MNTLPTAEVLVALAAAAASKDIGGLTAASVELGRRLGHGEVPAHAGGVDPEAVEAAGRISGRLAVAPDAPDDVVAYGPPASFGRTSRTGVGDGRRRTERRRPSRLDPDEDVAS